MIAEKVRSKSCVEKKLVSRTKQKSKTVVYHRRLVNDSRGSQFQVLCWKKEDLWTAERITKNVL